MNALTAYFTINQKWHVDYKPNRQQASVLPDKTGWIEQGTADI
jgi:hypothetical protein